MEPTKAQMEHFKAQQRRRHAEYMVENAKALVDRERREEEYWLRMIEQEKN